MLYYICNIGQRVREIKGGTINRSGREVWRVVVKGLGEEGSFLPFGQDAGEPQLSKDKHAADTSLVPPSKLRNFGKMDEGIKAYPFLTKLLPAKQERM